MKRAIIVGVLALLAVPADAQEAIPTGTRSGFRYHVSPVAQVSQVNGEAGVVTGLELGWRRTERLTLGLASYRLANRIEADRLDVDGDGARDIDFFYAGVTAAYAYEVRPGMRVTASGLVGGGEAHWRSDYWAGMPDPDHRDAEHRTSLVLEPGAGLEVALLPWARAHLGAGYRFVGGGESRVVEQDDLRGFTGSFSLRFGRF